MYRPPRQNNEQNNEEQVNIDEVLDKLKSSLPKIPGKIFADAAIVINDNFYFNLGWQTSIGLIRIYVPLYQNWDQLNSDDKIETIINRIRFSIGLPNLNLRQIF